MATLHLVEIGDLPAVQNGEMHGFLRRFLQGRKMRCCDVAQIIAAPGLRRQLQEPQPHRIGLIGGMIHQALGNQMRELAVNRAARLTACLDDIGKTHRLFGKGDQFQQRDDLAERAGGVFGFLV